MVMAMTTTAMTVINSGYRCLSLKSNVERKKKLSPRKFKAVAKAIESKGQQNQARSRRPQNADGEFFVDHTCIDCDTCRWMAPEIFRRIDWKSAVFKQPTTSDERLSALQALLCCPTNSIHTEKPAPDVLHAQKTFPLPIDEQKIPGVFHCGYHSDKSYGATSYLIVHPEGNIIIDSPRCTERLAHNIETLGGARYMFLTHKDDVADHDKWSKRFSLKIILHSGDECWMSINVSEKFHRRKVARMTTWTVAGFLSDHCTLTCEPISDCLFWMRLFQKCCPMIPPLAVALFYYFDFIWYFDFQGRLCFCLVFRSLFIMSKISGSIKLVFSSISCSPASTIVKLQNSDNYAS